MADLTPNVPEPSWWTVALTLFGTVAVTTVWKPLFGWCARRLDLARQEHTDELSTCRQEIKKLEARFREYQDRADGIILKLSVDVAKLETRLAEREADVMELRQQLQQPRRRVLRDDHAHGPGTPP